MNKYIPTICSSRLFAGISEDEVTAMLSCLNAREDSFTKHETIIHAGDKAAYIGLVLDGQVLIVQADIWGNRNILSKLGPGQSFALAYACANESEMNVDVAADTDAVILKLDVARVLTVCSSACTHHNRIIRNLVTELAENNLRIHDKLMHIGQRSTRDKLMSFFSAELQRHGKSEFEIDFNRQQLADYLAVDRSGLSAELSKMQKEGLIEFNKNRFILKTR